MAWYAAMAAAAATVATVKKCSWKLFAWKKSVKTKVYRKRCVCVSAGCISLLNLKPNEKQQHYFSERTFHFISFSERNTSIPIGGFSSSSFLSRWDLEHQTQSINHSDFVPIRNFVFIVRLFVFFPLHLSTWVCHLECEHWTYSMYTWNSNFSFVRIDVAAVCCCSLF